MTIQNILNTLLNKKVTFTTLAGRFEGVVKRITIPSDGDNRLFCITLNSETNTLVNLYTEIEIED